MITEAIILAGGFGTRLKGVISDIPKPMAPVANKPFLEYLIKNLHRQGITRVILAVGYKHEIITDCFGAYFEGVEIDYAIENEPLGTGGAISFAMEKLHGDKAFVLNGDSFIHVDLKAFYNFCLLEKASFGIVLKEMVNFDRYGTVVLSAKRIEAFKEKQAVTEGMINCGLYFIDKNFLSSFGFPKKYSFETEFMEKHVTQYHFSGFPCSGYFIDIGIPEDYTRAQTELPIEINKQP